MVFGKDMDAWQRKGKIGFTEKQHSGWFLTGPELKLLSIAGVGFFMDSYDLFIINMVVPILIIRYFPGQKNITWGLAGGVLKASANIGNVIGQVLFGFLGDSFGRQFVYGKECIIIIVATAVMISAPDYLTGTQITVWITVCRIVMGIGIGGDYPMSAAVVADRSHLNRRGALLATIFSAQGWGGLWGALFSLIVIACYYHNIYVNGKYAELSGAWRILFAFGLVPAIAVLYFRLTMAESLKFIEARKLQDNPDLIYETREGLVENGADGVVATTNVTKKGEITDDETTDPEDDAMVRRAAFGWSPIGKRAHNGEFFSYFSQWRHMKILIGTAASWFLLDLAFYGINLNQSFILTAINFTAKQPYRKLLDTAVGNVIIIAAGYFPGYFFSIAFIEVVGRKPIQLMGFLFTGVLLLVAGVDFHSLRQKTAAFFIVFTLLQFFFNFGANTTTFVIPAEVFPSRIRATAHGISAAVGKCGAIVTGLAFVSIAKRIGTGDTLLILMACSFAGIFFTFLIPETKGRDADVVDREELLAEARARGDRDPYATVDGQQAGYGGVGKAGDNQRDLENQTGGRVNDAGVRDPNVATFTNGNQGNLVPLS